MDYSIDEYYLDLIQVLFKVNAKLTEFLNTHTNILTINYLLKNYLLSQRVVELYWQLLGYCIEHIPLAVCFIPMFIPCLPFNERFHQI